VEYLDL
jgi:hypothetical protein